jgi:magnesium-transporting ATPase (P-type)
LASTAALPSDVPIGFGALDPSLSSALDVVRSWQTDLERGLSQSEAEARRARTGANQLVAAPPVPAWRKLLAQFQDPLVYLLLGAIVVSFVAWTFEGAHGAPLEALVVLGIVIANAILGYVEEAKAEQAVAALQRMTRTTAGVLRDGAPQRIPAVDLVPGDLLLLAEGDAVAADARLVAAFNLEVAEASLTGESEPVMKRTDPLDRTAALGDRVNMVYKGTAVVRGAGRAVVTATGMATEMGHIAGLLERTQEDPTPLEREIAAVGRTLGLGVIAIAVVVVTAVMLGAPPDSVADIVQVLLLGVSLAVAAVPEGLPAILSVVLAVGVQRMAARRAIVKKLSSVETLGSTSVICSDKTGTLTRNEMTIERVVTHSAEVEVTGTGYRPEGELRTAGKTLDDGPAKAEIERVLCGGALANDAVLRQEAGGWVIQGDPTDAAFLVAERKAGLLAQRVERFERLAELPFSSERKLMSTVARDRWRGQLCVVTKGAPDVLLNRCVAEQVGQDMVALTPGRRAEILHDVERLSDRALRTLAVAYRELAGEQAPDTNQPGADERLERDLTYAGVVGMIDPPRTEAAAAIREAHGAGVRTIMITGDHPRTAARIAASLGVVEGDGRALTGVELDRLDAAEFARAARTVSVFARVAPEHKLRIVDALQAGGAIVAMTGDGVNDAPALKSADIGIAMGITGTEVSKEAAKMILADDDFSTIVAALREGRLIFDNIKKFLRYLLSSNLGEVLTVFVGVVAAGVLGLESPSGDLIVALLPTQILWINLLTDTAPALALGIDPPTEDVMLRPPRSLDERIIDRSMQFGVLIVGCTMAAVTLLTLDWKLPGGLIEGSSSVEEARSAAFTVLVLAQLFNAFNSRSERTTAVKNLFNAPWLWAAVAVSLLLQILVVEVPWLGKAFATYPLSVGDWLQCAGMASAVLWIDELRKWVLRRRANPE